MAKVFTGEQLRAALEPVVAWALHPEEQEKPVRSVLANAVRTSLAVLEQDAPGHSVEVRVPPFGAVQVVEGMNHRRGTPPNVVELTALQWLQLCLGIITWRELEDQYTTGFIVSGTRAGDVAQYFPLVSVKTFQRETDD